VADRLLHFATGMVLGLVLFVPGVVRAWRAGDRLSPVLGRMIVTGLTVGGLAVVPSVLSRIGVPSAVCRGWWMNVFVFHPLLDRLRPGGLLIGEAATISLFCCQYVLVLVALRCRRKQGASQGCTDG